MHGRLLSFVHVMLFTFNAVVLSEPFYMFGSEPNLTSSSAVAEKPLCRVGQVVTLCGWEVNDAVKGSKGSYGVVWVAGTHWP